MASYSMYSFRSDFFHSTFCLCDSSIIWCRVLDHLLALFTAFCCVIKLQFIHLLQEDIPFHHSPWPLLKTHEGTRPCSVWSALSVPSASRELRAQLSVSSQTASLPFSLVWVMLLPMPLSQKFCGCLRPFGRL